MPDTHGPSRPMTRMEANALLPLVRGGLKRMRDIRDLVPKLQAQVEIEDLTGRAADGAIRPESKAVMERILGELKGLSRDFQEELESFTAMGARLKDLDQGLVDFFGQVAGETVFLCWKEEEAEVGWYHPLDGGYRQRKPLEG